MSRDSLPPTPGGDGTDGVPGYVGSDIDRREDPELVTGEATFLDDVNPPGVAHMAICRSQHAHARIHGVDTSPAEELDGVVATFTWADVEAAGVPGDVPCIYRVPDLIEPPHRILARDTVRYQGKPVAAVVAEDRPTAARAAELVSIDYERLEAVLDPEEATEDDAPTLHEAAPDNVCFDWSVGNREATDRAFAGADSVVECTLRTPRLVPNALEPRGVLAEYEGISEKLTVHMPSQNPFTHQEILAEVLDHPKRKIRVAVPNVGGGFGSKSMFYPEEALAAFASMQLARPVKWVETRTEAFRADEHGRGQTVDVAIAVSEGGDVEGLRVESFAELGGDLSSKGAVGPTTTFGPLVSGQYAIPAIHFQSHAVFTNATPTAPYRGVGRAEAAYAIERAVALAARELDMDPAEIRRRNFVPPDAFPYETAVGTVYDSGEYERALDVALELADYEGVRERQRERESDGRYLGVGLSSFVEPGGLAPASASEKLGMSLPDSTVKTSFWESSQIEIHENGEVTAYCGTASHGQSSETTHAQVVADALGIDIEDVEVVEGKDTDRGPPGSGTFGSRAAVVGGNSLARSASKVIDEGRRIAAHQLEAPARDVEYERGEFFVSGAPDRSMTLTEVAQEAYLGVDLPEGMEPGRLAASTYYDPSGLTWSFGTHVVVVEVDPETGEIEFEDYVAVDDCGTQINPRVVEGQIQGGIAQGLGAAMYEEAVYDENGTLLSGSYQDYAIPKAEHVPEMTVEKTVTPSPLNELGVKGVGESGTVAAPPAIVNAVTDALTPLGIDHVDVPLTHRAVWEAIEAARDG